MRVWFCCSVGSEAEKLWESVCFEDVEQVGNVEETTGNILNVCVCVCVCMYVLCRYYAGMYRPLDLYQALSLAIGKVSICPPPLPPLQNMNIMTAFK